jgi:hypothetical protein
MSAYEPVLPPSGPSPAYVTSCECKCSTGGSSNFGYSQLKGEEYKHLGENELLMQQIQVQS